MMAEEQAILDMPLRSCVAQSNQLGSEHQQDACSARTAKTLVSQQ